MKLEAGEHQAPDPLANQEGTTTRFGRILLLKGSCHRSYSGLSTNIVEVVPAEPDARAEQDGDDRTQAASSQFRSVHHRWLAVALHAVPPERLEPEDDKPSG